MNPSPEQLQREQQLTARLWTWLTLLAVVGAYLLSWACLLLLWCLQR